MDDASASVRRSPTLPIVTATSPLGPPATGDIDAAFEPALRSVATRCGGVVLTREVLEAGYSELDIARLVRNHSWVRLRRGAYATGARWSSGDDLARYVLRARAVLRALDGSTYLTHVSGLAVHGADLHEPDLGLVRVVRDGPNSGRTQAGVVQSVSWLPTEHRGRVGDLNVCTPARALVDLARDPAVSLEQAVVAADSLLHRGVLTSGALAEMLEQCRDWPGSLRAARAIHLADGRAESVGESLSRLLLISLDLAPEELQVQISTDMGVVYSDLGWPSRRVVLEFDGRVKLGRLLRPGETPAEAAWRERQREQAIERAGWVIVRIQWSDLFSPVRVRRRILEAFAHAERRGLVGSVA